VSESSTSDPPISIASGGDVRRIGLALSGGGVRAATFHMGVLRRLAAEALLERVSVISTVSGGSLVTAAIMSEAGMKWPSSKDFIEKVYLAIRSRMTSCDLFSLEAIGWRGLMEFNVDLVWNRASVLARLLERNWGVSGTLADLPDAPHWLINTTSRPARTGGSPSERWGIGALAGTTLRRFRCRLRPRHPPRSLTSSVRCDCHCRPQGGGKPIRPRASRFAHVLLPGTRFGYGTAVRMTTWASKPSPSPARVYAAATS
jgi:hypothetical protein